MSRFVVTPRGLRDLAEIAKYTEDVWGLAQAKRYNDRLIGRFDWLARHPALGKPREECGEGYHAFREGQHLIFYRINGETIEIIGVPHQSMDIIAYFDEDAP